jgi:hypothetical protein
MIGERIAYRRMDFNGDRSCDHAEGSKEPRAFRHLSPSIAPKRKLMSVDVTANLAYAEKKSHKGMCLHVQETIEWE